MTDFSVHPAKDRIKLFGKTAEFILSNGIVLSFRAIPPMLLQAVANKFVPPKPPIRTVEGADREDFEDATYVRGMSLYFSQQDAAINNMILAGGSSFVSAPEGMFGPEEDGWIEIVQTASALSGEAITIEKEDKDKRYLAWLRYYAMETNTDVAVCNTLPQQLGNVREGEIEAVVDLFNPKPQTPAKTNRRRT